MALKRLMQDAEAWSLSQCGADPAHDAWHVRRVKALALKLARGTRADRHVVALAALFHDVDDWKQSGSLKAGPRRVAAWLQRHRAPAELAAKVVQAIQEVTYKGAGVATPVSSLEAALVQDADRLDAMGAIGIARTFAYGGAKGRALYDPQVKPVLHASFRAYARGRGHTLNHFHEKLLLLKGRLRTPQARRLAARRHARLQAFVRDFLSEWRGLS